MFAWNARDIAHVRLILLKSPLARGSFLRKSIQRTPITHHIHIARQPRPSSSQPVYTRSSARAGLSLPLTAAALALVLLTSIVASGWSGLAAPPTDRHLSTHSNDDSSLSHSKDIGHFRYEDVMSSSLPPGRPGNMTAEQEAKLREFWVALLGVFGVRVHAVDHEASESHGAPADHGDDVDAKHRTGTFVSEKRKKRHLSLFGRSRKDRDLTPSSPVDATVISSPTEADDKYGQTKQFKDALASTTPDDLRTMFWSMVKHDNPDALLLRFLRARKWDVEKALVMLVSTIHWRCEVARVDDDIMKAGEAGALEAATTGDMAAKKEAEDFLKQLRMGMSYLHGVDKAGRPICFVRVKLHRQGEQSESSLERYTVFVIETARFMLTGPVDTAAVVFDMTDSSMANMDYVPVKFMIKCFEANYPESLGVILVHKAPWIFQGIWGIIKGWLDPVVAGKIHFTKSVDDLQAFIPREHIMRDLGGDEDWSYRYIEPDPTENHHLADNGTRQRLLEEREGLVRRYESATLRWLDSSSSNIGGGGGGEDQKNASSSIDQIRSDRNQTAELLRASYWELDPYLRARTIYDRTGIIGDGGRLQFYHPPSSSSSSSSTSSTSSPSSSSSINPSAGLDLRHQNQSQHQDQPTFVHGKSDSDDLD